jgi:hypothetical protein
VRAEIVRAVPPYAGCTEAALGSADPSPATNLLVPFAPFTPTRDVDLEGTRYDTGEESGWQWPRISGERTEAGSPSSGAAVERSDLVLVREPRLYDSGGLLRPSGLLLGLVAAPCASVSPDDAAAAGLADGQSVRLTTAGGAVDTVLAVRPDVPVGVVLLTPGLDWPEPVEGLWGEAHAVSVALEPRGSRG